MSENDSLNGPQSLLLSQRKWNEVLTPMGLKDDDIRAVKLREFLPKVPADPALSTRDIVQRCLSAMDRMHISEEERALLDRVTTEEIDDIMPLYASRVSSLIRGSGKQNVSIVSVGCGSSGHIERIIDEAVKQELGDIALSWTGVETMDKRTPDSFFRTHDFHAIPAGESPDYASLIADSDSFKLLTANFSFHHMDSDFGEFLARCQGFDRVLMLEQPVASALWNTPEHRIAKIGYDLLINAAIDPGWIAAAKEDPEAFTVNYLLEEEIPPEAVVTPLPDIVPGCAMIDLKP